MSQDFYELSSKMKKLFPSNPQADRAALMGMVDGGSVPQDAPPPTANYMQESADVAPGSLQMDKDYSINDFAALAGVKPSGRPQPIMETITDHDYQPLPSTFEDKDTRIAQLEERVAKLEKMLQEERTDEILPAVAAVAGRAVAGAVVNKLTANKKNKKPTHKMPDGTVMKGKSHKKPFVKDKAQKESFIKDELYRKLSEYEFKKN
jgi:hypothetical protein